MGYREHNIKIPTNAGHDLSGTLFTPESAVKQTLVVSSATGMLQKFYYAFSRHFASLGYAVLTFDYWGIGDSGGQVRDLQENPYDLIHWGANDQAAAVRWIKNQYTATPLTLVTHSIGGQLCGFNPEHPEIDRIIMVASQTSYWGQFTGWQKYKMWVFWHVMIPWLSFPFGYFPAKHIGLFENLPREMAYQWKRWGKHPEYMMSEHNARHLFEQLQMPILSLSFPGDSLAPSPTVDWLARQYSNAEVQRVHYTHEGDKPGHFGYFRPFSEPTLWRYTHSWITQNHWGK
jgi:predicted alpha/beta hydrolase